MANMHRLKDEHDFAAGRMLTNEALREVAERRHGYHQ